MWAIDRASTPTALSFFGILVPGTQWFLPDNYVTNEQMSDYPQLAAMGIEHAQQIDNYSVNSIGYTDVLRIVYERPKGSLLPLSKTYKFPRVQQTSKTPGKGEADVTMNSDPVFRAAVSELQDLLKSKGKDRDIAGAITEELRLLEEDIALRSECIKRLLEKL